MIKFIGVGPQGQKHRTLDLFCDDCEFEWVAARFPMSLETIEAITNSLCPNCRSKNVSVFEDNLRDPNDAE